MTDLHTPDIGEINTENRVLVPIGLPSAALLQAVYDNNNELVFCPIYTKDESDRYTYGGSPRSNQKKILWSDILNVFLRPVDDEWVMGDDYKVRVHRDLKFSNLKHIVDYLKSIPASRIIVKHYRKQTEREVGNEDWTLRRLGVISGDVFIIQPTMSGVWYWNNEDYYKSKFIDEIIEQINAANGRMSLNDLAERLKCPPIIKTSIGVFIKSYPDNFEVYTESTTGRVIIQRNELSDALIAHLPNYSNIPINLGENKKISYDFNFDDYADIDDTRPVELDFVIPSINYNVQIVRATNIPGNASNNYPDPFCILYFNSIEIGRTEPRAQTLYPVWSNSIFCLPINANQNIYDCILRVEVCHSKILDDGSIGKYGILGFAELTRTILVDFLCGLYQNTEMFQLFTKADKSDFNISTLSEEKENDLIGRDVIKTKDDFVSRSVSLKGGKIGFEVNIIAAFNLPEPSNKRSQIFALVLWNGEEIGRTFAEPRNVRNPHWDETYTLPVNCVNGITSEIIEKLRTSVMELQVWASQPLDKDEKDELFGCIQFKNDELVDVLTSTYPWAKIYRGQLQKSLTLSVSGKRKMRIQGNLIYSIGPSGLNIKRAVPYDLKILSAENLPLFQSFYMIVEYNYQIIYRSSYIQLTKYESTYASAIINHSCMLEVDNDSDDVSESYLKIELFEAIASKGYSGYGEYLGCVNFQGDELRHLFLGEYATVGNYQLKRNEEVEAKKQSLIHGHLVLRTGKLAKRLQNERILIIYSCSDLIGNNIENINPFVVVTIGGVEIGQTMVLYCTSNPLWDMQNNFLINISDKADFDMKLEVFHSPHGRGKIDSNSGDNNILLASCLLDSASVMAILQSETTVERSIQLKSVTNKGFSESSIRIGSCGSSFNSFFEYKQHLALKLQTEIERKKLLAA